MCHRRARRRAQVCESFTSRWVERAARPPWYRSPLDAGPGRVFHLSRGSLQWSRSVPNTLRPRFSPSVLGGVGLARALQFSSLSSGSCGARLDEFLLGLDRFLSGADAPLHDFSDCCSYVPASSHCSALGKLFETMFIGILVHRLPGAAR